MNRAISWSAALVIQMQGRAFAEGALVVDDASITPAHACQLEAWVRQADATAELTAVPACTWGGIEFSVGASQYLSHGAGTPLSAGAKHVWLELGTASVGIATSLGVSWNGPAGSGTVWTANMPVTIGLGSSGRSLLHANVGWMAGPKKGPLAGMGLESTLSGKLTLLAEAYVQHDHLRVCQAGLRFAQGSPWSVDVLGGYTRSTSNTQWSLVLGINLPLSRPNLTP